MPPTEDAGFGAGDPQKDDKERIHEEMGDHGDTRTVHPRLVCENCDSFVYLGRLDGMKREAVRAECNCKHGDPTRGEIPEEWIRIGQYTARADQ